MANCRNRVLYVLGTIMCAVILSIFVVARNAEWMKQGLQGEGILIYQIGIGLLVCYAQRLSFYIIIIWICIGISKMYYKTFTNYLCNKLLFNPGNNVID